MQPNAPSDIYLMKREKSRAGCMTMFIATLVALALAAGFAVWRWTVLRQAAPAEPLEFPAAPVEADPPSIQLAQPVEEQTVSVTPAPAPEPVKWVETSADQATPVAVAAAKPTPAPESAAAPTQESTIAPAPVPAPLPSGGDADALLAQARESFRIGDYQSARTSGLAALAARPGDAAIEMFLNELAMPLLASPRAMNEKTEYTVQSGDYLGKLAALFNTPVALIARANDIKGANIRIGQKIILLDGNAHTFALTVSKSRNDLLLTLDGQYFKRYRVSTGENAKTPTGTFHIVDKIAQPAWHKPGGAPIPYGDPENLLGTHWLALDLPGYGLHGTWDPASIGTQSSAGCVRLLNDEIEELYTILPKGTAVTITE